MREFPITGLPTLHSILHRIACIAWNCVNASTCTGKHKNMDPALHTRFDESLRIKQPTDNKVQYCINWRGGGVLLAAR